MGLKKRPCRICRGWFKPSKRGGHRQKTCGADECRRLWHLKKCRQWHSENRECRLEDRLAAKVKARKIERPRKTSVPRPGELDYPSRLAREVLGVQGAVFIELLLKVVLKLAREVKRVDLPVNKGDPG